MIEAVIFDCDGTLVDSESIASGILASHATEVGLTITAEESRRRFTGRKMADCVAELEEQLRKPLGESFIAAFRHRLDAAFHERLQPIAGADELLRELHLPFCIASNGPLQKLHLTLGTTGLREHFTDDRIFSAYEIGVWKPDPGLFLHAAMALGVPPEACAVVEDSAAGFAAGLAAGMTVFAYGEAAAPEGVRPLRHLTDLLDAVSS